MVHFMYMRWGGGGGGGVVGVEEAVKYCKLKDCQKDDAQKRW